MRQIFLLFFTALACFIPAFAQTDTQFWNETQVSFPVIKKKDPTGKEIEKLSLFLNGNLRFGQNVRHFTDERIGFGLTYRQNKHLTFTPSYIYIAQQPIAHRRLFETRLRFAVGLENHWKKFALDDRNLIEYRFRNGMADSARYRNKLKFTYPVRRGGKEIFAPFAADEVFYDFHVKAFSRNELTLGISRKINPRITTDFFYLWQENRSGNPKRINAFGVNLKVKID